MIIIPADKAADNYTFANKNAYIESLCKELGIGNGTIIDNDIHEYVENKSALDVINAQCIFPESVWLKLKRKRFLNCLPFPNEARIPKSLSI